MHSEVARYDVQVPGQPYRLASTPDGSHVLVSLRAGPAGRTEGVAVLDARQDYSLQHVVPMPGPRGLTTSRNGRHLFVAQDSGAVFVFDLEAVVGDHRRCLLTTIPTTPSGSTGMVTLSVDEAFCFTSEERAGCLTVLDVQRMLAGRTDAVLGTIAMDRAPIATVCSSDGRFLYATSQATGTRESRGPGRVAVIDVPTAASTPAESVLSRVSVGNAVRLTLSHNDRIAWVTLRAENRLCAFETDLLRSNPERGPLASIETGPMAAGVCVAADDRLVLVANSNRFDEPTTGGQTVTLVDARDVESGRLRVIADVSVGAFPRELLTLPTGDVGLTNHGSASVTIFGADDLSAALTGE